MTKYQVNKTGVAHAKHLISQGAYDTETPWSDAAASAGEENEVIEDDGYKEWSKWHLAEDVDATEGTKGRFRFPYGDFEKVNRAALIHAKQRAAQNDHDEIVKAADEVLEKLDAATK
jgi:hypothetical protein